MQRITFPHVLVLSLIALLTFGPVVSMVPGLGMPSVAYAEHGGDVDGFCSPDGTFTLTKGDVFEIIITFGNGGSTDVLFTATMNTNIFFGPEHVFARRSVPAGLGVRLAFLISTAAMPLGTDRVLIEVTSDATGSTVLGTCDFTMTLTARPPVVDAGPNVSGNESDAITLNGSASHPDGLSISLLWTYAAGAGVDPAATCAFATPNVAVTTITCTDNGTYTATLTASDGVNPPVSESTTVTVANVAPTVNAGPDATLLSGQTFALNAGFTDPGIIDKPWRFRIDWGDGTSSSGSTNTQGAGTVVGSHQYVVPGTYTLIVCVTDKDGGQGCDDLRLEVRRLRVSIDIKPGSDPNAINLASEGIVPVGVLTGTYSGFVVDATSIVRSSVLFAGAPALDMGGSPQDLDQDGDLDKVFFFATNSLNLTRASTLACLTGQTTGNLYFEGCDSVRIVSK